MRRRTAVLLGILVALVAAAEVIGLAGVLAADRRADRQRYAEAIAQQRRAAGRATYSGEPHREVRTRAPMTFCVHGVDTFVTALRNQVDSRVLNDRQRLDIAVFYKISDLAVRAQRYVEQAKAGPALPQRMGRMRAAESGVLWQPLEPVPSRCGDGEAYAAFRIDPDELSANPRAASSPAR